MRGEEYNFADVVGKARTKCETRFADGAKEVLLEDTDWTWQDELESLKEEISNVADQCRKDETKKMVNLIEVYHLRIACDVHSISFHRGTLKNKSLNPLTLVSTKLPLICGTRS